MHGAIYVVVYIRSKISLSLSDGKDQLLSVIRYIIIWNSGTILLNYSYLTYERFHKVKYVHKLAQGFWVPFEGFSLSDGTQANLSAN